MSGTNTLIDDDFEDYENEELINQSIYITPNSPLHQFNLDAPLVNDANEHTTINEFDADHRKVPSTSNLENVLRQWNQASDSQSGPSKRSLKHRKRNGRSTVPRSFGVSMGLHVPKTTNGRSSPSMVNNQGVDTSYLDTALPVESELSEDDADFRPANRSNRFSSSLMRLHSLTKNKLPSSTNHSDTTNTLSDDLSVSQLHAQSSVSTINHSHEIGDEKELQDFVSDERESPPAIEIASHLPSDKYPIHDAIRPSAHNPFDESAESKTLSSTNFDAVSHQSHVTPDTNDHSHESSNTHHNQDDGRSSLSTSTHLEPRIITKSLSSADHLSLSPISSSSKKANRSDVDQSTPSHSPIVSARSSRNREPTTPVHPKSTLDATPHSPSSIVSPTTALVTPSRSQSDKATTPSVQKAVHAITPKSVSAAPAQLAVSDLDDKEVKQRFQGSFVGFTRDILLSLHRSDSAHSIGQRAEAAAFTLETCLTNLNALAVEETVSSSSPVSRSFGAASRRELVFIPSQSFVDDELSNLSSSQSPSPLTSETSLASAPRLDIIKVFAQPKPVYQSPRAWIVSEFLVGVHQSIAQAESNASHLCALFSCISEMIARFQALDQLSKQNDNSPISQLFRSFAVPFSTSWAYHPSPIEQSTFNYPANSSLTISQFLLLELLDARASAIQCVLAQIINQWQVLPDAQSAYEADVDGSWVDPYFNTITEFDALTRHAHWTAFERAQLLGCSMYSLMAHVLSSVMNAPELSMQDGVKLKLLASALQDFAQRLAGDAGVQAMECAGLSGLRDLGLLLLLEKDDIDLNMIKSIAPSLDLLTIHRICFTFMQTEGNEPVSPELLTQISQALASLEEDQLQKTLATEPQCLLLIRWKGGQDRQVSKQIITPEFVTICQQHYAQYSLIQQ